MSDYICPICGSSECEVESKSGTPLYYFVVCKTMSFRFFISEEILAMQDNKNQSQCFNLIVSHLLRQRSCEVNGKTFDWHFFFEASYKISDTDQRFYVNLAEELLNYPSMIISRIDVALLNLSMHFPVVGRNCSLPVNKLLTHRILLCDTESAAREANVILSYLSELDYIKSEGSYLACHISLEGWKRIEFLKSRLNEIKQGFIAMSYNPEIKPILDAFKVAINESGYKAQVIGEKEHNNQIVPEMFFEIERSKFMVVDVTEPNFGAYYEAGYAQALGKQVIVCCREDVFYSARKKKKPHFDISQKAMIVWTTPEELIKKLKIRIEATVR